LKNIHSNVSYKLPDFNGFFQIYLAVRKNVIASVIIAVIFSSVFVARSSTRFVTIHTPTSPHLPSPAFFLSSQFVLNYFWI